MIKAVIFDIGGVLIKNGVFYVYRKYPRFEKIFKLNYLIPCELGRIKDKELWPLLEKDLPQMDITYLKNYIFDHFTLQKGVFDLAIILKNKGIKVAILSNNLSEWVQLLFTKYELYDLFERKDIIVSAEVKCRKPNPEIFLLTLKKLGLMADECLFFDDQVENIAGAKKVGIRAVQFKTVAQLKDILKKKKLL